MFAVRERRRGAAGLVDVAFTDRHGGVSEPPFDSLDLRGKDTDRQAEYDANLVVVAEAFDVAGLTTMRQVHGNEVAVIPAAREGVGVSDGLVTATYGVALCVRVADCVPVVLADAERGVVGVAHAGRPGVASAIVGSTVEAMRDLGADAIHGWIGPHVCGGCYEVPFDMRAEVSQVVPTAFACTTWGTPSLDLGAAVTAQLEQQGCTISNVSTCTKESADLYSYRRDGDDAGRFAGLIVLRADEHD